jgi:hypothetical protein
MLAKNGRTGAELETETNNTHLVLRWDGGDWIDTLDLVSVCVIVGRPEGV